MPAALLKFQIGPVQDFIAQARSTRDLWSGSFLISWMMAQAIAWLRKHEDCGTTAKFVFPCIPPSSDAEDFPPTLRWIESTSDMRQSLNARKALMPAIPNVLLAKVPASCSAETLECMVRDVFSMEEGSCWRSIGDACHQFFSDHGMPLPDSSANGSADETWHRQLGSHWQISWQLVPYVENEESARRLFETTPIGREFCATNSCQLDLWMANYHVLSHRLDARRQTRDFSAWIGPSLSDSSRRTPDMDAFTGRAEAIINKEWLTGLHQRNRDTVNRQVLKNLFRSSDSLSAISIVKRVWHKAFLEETQDFKKPTAPLGDTYFNIPSTPGIAAFPWVRKLEGLQSASNPKLTEALNQFQAAIQRLDAYREMDFAKGAGKKWLRRLDWEVFHETFWENEIREAKELGSDQAGIETACEGLEALRTLLHLAKIGSPGHYWAVVAMDGDGLGKWLSGTNFREGLTLEKHEAVSRGLCLATLGGSNKVVSQLEIENAAGADNVDQSQNDSGASGVFEKPWFNQSRAQGKVIYAGADDVLAIVPAEQALDCARAMEEAFANAMHTAVPLGPNAERFTISAGIAIGHIKEPLQDMVHTAFEELRRAKREFEGDAVAVTLFKRSGEMIRWGAKMNSAAFPLLDSYRHGRSATGTPASGRFPYKLAELLRPYQSYYPDPHTGLPDFSRPLPLTAEIKAITKAEFAHVVRQQAYGLSEADCATLLREADAFLDELLPSAKRPLNDFADLFLLDAFINRSGE